MKKYIIIISVLIQFILAESIEPFHLRVMATTNVSGETDPCG